MVLALVVNELFNLFLYGTLVNRPGIKDKPNLTISGCVANYFS